MRAGGGVDGVKESAEREGDISFFIWRKTKKCGRCEMRRLAADEQLGKSVTGVGVLSLPQVFSIKGRSV